MKRYLNTLQPQLLLLLFYAFIATALLAPLTAEQAIPAIVDYANHIVSVIEAKAALAEGQFPLRIAPLELSGWRYPTYQFYSPTTYTFAGLIYKYLTPANPITAVKFTIWFALVAGGLFMQRLAYWFVKSRPAAILAGVVYLTAPYYIVIVTGFGNLCETVALGLVPAAIYYSLQRYLYPRQAKTLLQTGLLWYLLITIHLVTFVYAALFTAIFLLLVTCQNPHHWKNLFATGIGFAFGCLLALWFLAPIGLLQKYFLIANTTSSATQFQSFSPSISDLFFPGHLKFQGSIGHNHVAIGWPMLLAVGICFYALINKSNLKNVRANYWLPFLLILFFLVFMLAWSPINVWQWLPSPLLIGQYCWRILGQLLWVGAVLFAWAVCWLFKNKLDARHTVIGVLLLVITASAAFPNLYSSYLNINLADFIKHPHSIFNPDAYTIEFNKHTGFVDKIDNLRLDTLMDNGALRLNSTYLLSRSLLKYAAAPTISLHGIITHKSQQHPQLKAMINDTPIATYTLVAGKFHWDIPLNPAVLARFKEAQTLKFKIVANEKVRVPLYEIILTGFMQAPETLNVKAVQPFCQLQKSTTTCQMNVPKETHLLELPILFYPKLLKITVNGQPVSYQGIVYQNRLVAGVTPQPGTTNRITIQFIGLPWANYVSWLSWSLWCGLFIFLCIRRYINQFFVRVVNDPHT